MKLLVGLGNPGASYSRHRHNVGFMALEAIADRHRLGSWRKRFHGFAADGEIAGVRCLLLKPDTYMNESGRAVGEAARFLRIGLGDILVCHDEIDLQPGKLKVKLGGGNAGHNGLRSITAHLGNEYWRVRIGIGHPGVKELVHHWVLSDFAKSDESWLEPLLDAIADAAPHLVSGDDARFLSEVARMLAPPKQRKPREPATPAAEKPAATPEARSGALAERLKSWLSRGKS